MPKKYDAWLHIHNRKIGEVKFERNEQPKIFLLIFQGVEYEIKKAVAFLLLST
jgi:hypothetical protein